MSVFREEVPLNWNKLGSADPPLAVHCLAVGVVVNIVALGQGEPAVWVYLLALLPLALLLFTGLYMFVLPHATKWRSGRPADTSRMRT